MRDDIPLATLQAPECNVALGEIVLDTPTIAPRNSRALQPSETKTSVPVWVGPYPTVALLTLLTAPLPIPVWLDLLVGNLLGSFVMSFFTMPYYVNPLLKHWLAPPPNVPRAQTNWRGMGTVVIAMGTWTPVIYLITDGIWHLT